MPPPYQLLGDRPGPGPLGGPIGPLTGPGGPGGPMQLLHRPMGHMSGVGGRIPKSDPMEGQLQVGLLSTIH
jgi:hypothetical protein